MPIQACGKPRIIAGNLTFRNINASACRKSYPDVALYVKMRNLKSSSAFKPVIKGQSKASCPNDYGVLSKQPKYLQASGMTVVKIYPSCGPLKISR